MNDKWISVKDSLPTMNGGRVLIYDEGAEYNHIQIEYYFTDIRWSGIHNNITHWMPLLEAP